MKVHVVSFEIAALGKDAVEACHRGWKLLQQGQLPTGTVIEVDGNGEAIEVNLQEAFDEGRITQ